MIQTASPETRSAQPLTLDGVTHSYGSGFAVDNVTLKVKGGELVALTRPPETATPADGTDLMPIAADLPAADAGPAGGPMSPHGRSMNVLFVGGNVRLTTSPHVGPRGDDIYRNLFGHVAAGANPTDAVLGRTGDRP